MPSSIDAYNLIAACCLKAGIVTVQRGYHFPEKSALPAESYPLAAYIMDEAEDLNPQGNYAYLIEGRAKLQLWVYTGLSASEGMGSVGWDQMDTLKDALLRQFALYFAGEESGLGVASNTTVLNCERFEYWYWYPPLNTIILPAELTVKYRLGFA